MIVLIFLLMKQVQTPEQCGRLHPTDWLLDDLEEDRDPSHSGRYTECRTYRRSGADYWRTNLFDESYNIQMYNGLFCYFCIYIFAYLYLHVEIYRIFKITNFMEGIFQNFLKLYFLRKKKRMQPGFVAIFC